MIKAKIVSHVPIISVLMVLALTTWKCVPQEEIIDPEYTDGLYFSSDSVLFDTVFTGIGSVTKRLIVYNPNDRAVNISNIQLGSSENSSYKLLINGTQIGSANDLVILGKDSILLLIEVLIDPTNQSNPFLVRDSIVFETNGVLQDVKLIAWGQDANYLGNIILPCNSTWTSDKPYFLYSSVLVDSLCSLTIEKGTQIFAARGSYIYVYGTILANGKPEERIMMRHERRETRFDNIPGQWGGLVFLEGSSGNVLKNIDIRNAVYGIRLGSPDPDTIPNVILKNVIIENMSHSGILAFTSDLYAENTLVNNCIQFACANLAGGNYTYRHCTFASYNINIVSQNPAALFSNSLILDDNSILTSDLSVTLQNTIVYGKNADELQFNSDGVSRFKLTTSNNIFKTTNFMLDTLSNILNSDPRFINPRLYNYRLDTLSPAKDAGLALGIETDLDGNQRDNLPDIGAYERIE